MCIDTSPELIKKINAPLGLPIVLQSFWNRTLEDGRGLVLVIGPDRSGKSASMNAMLNEAVLRDRPSHIVDPVFSEPPAPIKSWRTRPEIGFGVAEAFRNASREGSQAIGIGPLTHEAQARINVKDWAQQHVLVTALTAPSFKSGLLTMARSGLSETLAAGIPVLALNQRLVKRLCHRCRLPRTDLQPILTRFGLTISPTASPRKAKGCDFCRHQGYEGQLILYEGIRMKGIDFIPELETFLSRPGNTPKQLDEQYQPLLAHGMVQVARGNIDFEEAWKTAMLS